MSRWHRVTRREPCPVCGKPDWCAWSPDRRTLKCERSSVPSFGFVLVKQKPRGGLFRRESDLSDSERRSRRGRTS